MDIFFYEAFHHEADLIKALLGNDLSYDFAPETIQETGHTQPPARLISVRTQSSIPPEWSDQLGGILSRSTGYDHLIAYASRMKKRIPLGYLEEYATRAVAEHAIMLAIALLRKLPQQVRQFPSFNRENLTGLECKGRNLLVVGVGRIGSEIVQIGSGIGFDVKGVDIVPRVQGVTYVSKEQGIPWAEVIICAMNLTDENRGYFKYELMRQARKGCIFVNIARGEHSPLDDLVRLLRENRLGGLGLDVFENESDLGVTLRTSRGEASHRATVVHQILSYPNVILTPHNAFNSEEAVQRKAEMSVQQIRYFFQHHDFRWKI